MNNDLKINLIDHLEKWLGGKFSDETLLGSELGIAGLDCESLINNIALEFNVDMSEFDFDKYYFKDDISFFNIFKKKRNKMTFNVLHLVKVIEKGKWFDPVC